MPSMAPIDFDSLSVAQQRTIDQICVEFEDRWIERPHPDIDAMLTQAPANLQAPLLHELLKIEIVYRRRRGEAVTIAPYRERFSQFDAAVRAAFGHDHWGDSGSTCGKLAAGDVVHRYRVLRPLGEGAFGSVYLARDEALGRDVALKTLTTDHKDDLLLEEARTAARLKHPGIATIYDTGRLADDQPYVVMEYIAGQTLRHLLDEDPLRFPVDDAGEVVAAMADTLEYAHQQGIVHRDLNPSNVILDENRDVRLTDFGLALHELDQADRRGEVAGSLAYIAPEQVRGESQHMDGRADVWSLGVILYELLTGRLPFAGSTVEDLRAEILQREPRVMRREQRRITGHLERVCLRCLRKDPAQRWATAGELSTALRPVPSASQASTRSANRRAWLWAAGLGLIATGIVIQASRPPNFFGSPYQTARVNIEVLINADSQIVPLSTHRPSVHGGDEIFIEIEATHPSHFHVWWIDSNGRVQLMHAPSTEQPKKTTRLRLPSDPQMAWPLPAEQPGGTETVFVLATDQANLPANVMSTLLPYTSRPPSMPVWYFQGQRELGRDRAGPTGELTPTFDPLGAWHRALAAPLVEHGVVQAVSFYCEASRP